MLSHSGGLVAGCLLLFGPVFAQEPLSLAEAERLALEGDPAVRQYAARADALREQAVADAQLPDPRLRLGVENLPTDPVAIDAEPMTMFTVGVTQEFPRGRSRELLAEQGLAQAAGEEARTAERRLDLLREVRRAWLEAWYQGQAVATLREAGVLFGRLVEITEAQYAEGRGSQQAILEARVEAARIADRESAAEAERESALAELARWIGEEARRPLIADKPPLPAIDGIAAIEERLPAHPSLAIETAAIAASEKETARMREAYQPGFALDLAYSKRFGEENGRPRADLVTAMVEMEMPLFPGRRQGRRVAAGERLADAARYARDDRRRELRRRLQADYALWSRLGERLERYRRELVPHSALAAAAADRAYRSLTVDFGTLVRAQLSHLESRLEALRLESDHAKAQADLAWFQPWSLSP